MTDKPVTETPTASEPAAALGISYSVQIDAKRSLVFQTHVPQGVTVRSLHFLTDALASVGERQIVKQDLVELTKQLNQHETALTRFIQDLAKVDEKFKQDWDLSQRKGEIKLNSSDAATRNTLVTSQARYREEIVKIKAEMADCQAKINFGDGNGTAGPTTGNAGVSDS
jgi:hypothetical protein